MNEEQRALCMRYGAAFAPPAPRSKLGIAPNVRTGVHPVNGLRHPPVGDTNGWFVWAGDVFEERADFFVPLHLHHVEDWHRGILKFLALPPGWRFLFAQDDEDIWFDPTLLSV